MFADDAEFMREVKSVDNCLTAQGGLHRPQSWFDAYIVEVQPQ